MNKPREEEKEMYKFPSCYDDDNILQDCTCGKCGEKSWEKEYNRKYAPLMAKIDEYYWQKGYSKLENDLRKFISQALSSQLKEVLGVINSFKLDTCETVGCGCNGDKRYNEALDDLKAEVEKLV